MALTVSMHAEAAGRVESLRVNDVNIAVRIGDDVAAVTFVGDPGKLAELGQRIAEEAARWRGANGPG